MIFRELFKEAMCTECKGLNNVNEYCYVYEDIYQSRETITIHHECPRRKEISHPRGRNLIQGRGLPLFEKFCLNIKTKIKEKFYLFLVGFTTFPSLRVFLSGIEMGYYLEQAIGA